MRITCALNVNNLDLNNLDVVVLPEGISWKEIKDASSYYPDSIIVGSTIEHDQCSGVLWHRGKNQIEYTKVETDGRTRGSKNIQQNTVYEYDNLCVGLLVCIDIDNVEFSTNIINKIKSTQARYKLLCIPADMGSYWFCGESIPHSYKYEGIQVAISNNNKTHKSRCKSFITDKKGKKIVMQKDTEPIYAELN